MNEKELWNEQVDHPMQAFEWGEFRQKTGVRVVRSGGMQITIHKIPHTPWSVGYAPKSKMPTEEMVRTLSSVVIEHNCIFIKLEPKVEAGGVSQDSIKSKMSQLGFFEGRSLFTKHNFLLDVSPSEEELLASFKQKTRYNIRVAEKRGVTVELDDSPDSFERYLELTEETTKRQGFYAHSRDYHQKMWETLNQSQVSNSNAHQLSAHLLVAKYPPSRSATEGRGNGEIITTWVLFRFNDTLYYPYGASTRAHRDVMANNLVMWEAIKIAKKWGLRYLDMWGALGPDPDPKDPWYGFHTFKSGYGARQVEYVGTWDYVGRPWLYKIYTLIDKLRWSLLRFAK